MILLKAAILIKFYIEYDIRGHARSSTMGILPLTENTTDLKEKWGLCTYEAH